jgi:hypothetical protein
LETYRGGFEGLLIAFQADPYPCPNPLAKSEGADSFDPTRPDHSHEDWEAVTAAIERVHASLTRMREFDGLEAHTPVDESAREHDALREHIAALIEVGASLDNVRAILDERALARR